MKRWITAGTVLLLAVTLAASKPDQTKPSLFSTLKVGQSVTLKDRGNSYEISTMDVEGPLTHKIIELGDDVIVLRDVAELMEVRIPIYSVKAVINVRTKPR